MVSEYKKIYKVSEVAEVLQTNKNFVYGLIRNGELPCLLIGNSKRVRGTDLESYIENHEALEVSV